MEKHVSVCSLVKKGRPSTMSMIEQLAEKISLLNQKVERLEKLVETKKRKIKPVDWLHSNYADNPSLSEKVAQIDFPTKPFLEKWMDLPVYILVQTLLREQLKEKSESPFLAFSTHPNKIFVCIETTPTQKIWTPMEKHHLVYWMNMIQKKTLNILQQSKAINNSDDDKAPTLYAKRMNKLLLSYQQPHVYSRVKNILYSLVKIEVKHILEYDFQIEEEEV
jgi:hypothetical protein